MVIQSIQNRIYEVRGLRVMLDFDLAQLYQVETRVLNQAVKRNLKRFPADFMFRLTASEYNAIQMQSQQTVSGMSSQIVTTSTFPVKRPNAALPYAFTEQGVAMLSGVLHSDTAINMNIAIMRAFVEMRRFSHEPLRFSGATPRTGATDRGHDVQLSGIYDAIENLLDDKVAQRKWEDRERIGFRKGN